MAARAKITSKGQVTLPKEIRDELDLQTGDEVEFYEESGQYHVRKVIKGHPFAPWRGFLRAEFAGIRSDDLVDEMRGERLDYRD